MKIYTKKGDKGKTQLLGGTMVDKFNYKIEAYGNIDELNSFIGHLHDQDINKNHKAIFELELNNLWIFNDKYGILININQIQLC